MFQSRIFKKVKRVISNEKGQDVVEYSLLLALFFWCSVFLLCYWHICLYAYVSIASILWSYPCIGAYIRLVEYVTRICDMNSCIYIDKLK